MTESETINVGDTEWKPQIVEHTGIVVANPFTLLQSAIEKGFDAERISQFMDLQDRMQKKQALEEYIAAMNRCQKRMPIVVRDSENKQTNSRFARLEAVANRIKPIYTEEGFTLEFGEEDSPLEKHRRIVCEVQHLGGHAKKFHLDSPIDDVGAKGAPNKTAVQGLGSLVSYLRRYLTLMIFNITVADEDTDGNSDQSKMTAEQCEYLRKKLAECDAVGMAVREYPFLNWLAEEQKDRENVKVLEDVQQRFFARALKALDRKIEEGKKKLAINSGEV